MGSARWSSFHFGFVLRRAAALFVLFAHSLTKEKKRQKEAALPLRHRRPMRVATAIAASTDMSLLRHVHQRCRSTDGESYFLKKGAEAAPQRQSEERDREEEKKAYRRARMHLERYTYSCVYADGLGDPGRQGIGGWQ